MKTLKPVTTYLEEETSTDNMRFAVLYVGEDINGNPRNELYAMFRTLADAERYHRPIQENYKGSPCPFEIREIVK